MDNDSKAPKIFKEEYGGASSNMDIITIIAAQRILDKYWDENLSVGYAKFDLTNHPSHSFDPFTSDQKEGDTHKIIFYTEPLEDEVEECKHEYKRVTAIDWNGSTTNCNATYNTYCPLCGKNLTESN